MIEDLRKLDAKTIDADLCIVGSGPAGITLARKLARPGRRIIVLESGGLERDEETQSLYLGEESGTLLPEPSSYLVVSRLRYLGGSTNHWEGWCRPLDAEDFEPRPWVPDSGWPIARSEVERWQDEAAGLCQITPWDYVESEAGKHPQLFPATGPFETRFFHISPPTRFGTHYRDDLASAPGVTLLLHANALELRTDGERGPVSRIEVGTLDGRRTEVRARHFVVATGAVENARLLLASRSDRPAGLGNDRDQVGRRFMDHPLVEAGNLVIPGKRLVMTDYHDGFVKRRGHEIRAVLRLHPTLQAERELLNALVVLEPASPDGRDTPLGGEMARFVQDLLDAPDGSQYHGGIRLAIEQHPDPANRVTLSEETDALGRPRAKLEWNLSEIERRTVVETLERFALELGRAGLGRVRLPWTPEDLWERARGSNHHIGTTRMSTDPASGVVDPDGRVHGIPNLWIAGSSVFPTSGAANPTLTLLALTLRLAARLEGELA